MLSIYLFNQVRSLKSEGLSQAAIARQLKIDPKTVARYLKSNTPPRYKPRTKTTRPDPLAGFVPKIEQWLKLTPTLTSLEIYELLLPVGYTGSERTINRRIKAIRKPPAKQRYFDQEYEPGEQAQFDFKEKVELPFVDGPRIAHLHFGTLPHSNSCFVRGYPARNFECYMDGIHEFFQTIGGMTENIRFDNLAPCVKKVLKGSDRLYTDKFIRAIAHYGFGTLPCAPGKGNEKGDVERDIRTFAARLKNRISHEVVVFKDWDHLNTYLASFMLERERPETKVLRTEEQKKLKPLPLREESVLCEIQVGLASSFGSCRVGKSSYSVPDAWISESCRVVIGPYVIKISREGTYHGDKSEVIHPRLPDGEHSLLLEHVLPSLIRKPHAMVRWAHRSILFPDLICQRFYGRLKKIEGYGAEREYLRAINLIHHTCLTEIIAGMELVLESKTEKLFDDLRELLLGERRPASVIDITSRFNQSPLKPELSIYDSLIPRKVKVP